MGKSMKKEKKEKGKNFITKTFYYLKFSVMKKLGIFFLTALMVSSCSTNKLILTPADSKRGDAVFSSIYPDRNYAELEDILLDTWTQQGKLNINRVLIDFNIEKISPDAIVDSAYLNLYVNANSFYSRPGKNQGKDSIVIKRVTSEWDEKSVTWNNQPETTTKNQVIIASIPGTQPNYEDIDITKIIRDIVREKNNRYGIMIRYKTERPYNVVFFASSNHPNKKLHPKLKIYSRKN